MIFLQILLGNKQSPNEETRQEESSASAAEDSYSDTDNDLSSDSSFEVAGKKKLYARRTTQIKRLRGENYKGYKRSAEGKITYNIERNKRIMKNCCSHTQPKKLTPRSLRCAEVTEESRKKCLIFFGSCQVGTQEKVS